MSALLPKATFARGGLRHAVLPPQVELRLPFFRGLQFAISRVVVVNNRVEQSVERDRRQDQAGKPLHGQTTLHGVVFQ